MPVVTSTRPARRRREQFVLAAALIVWLAAVAVGWRELTAYAFKTERAATTCPAAWPQGSQLPHEAGRGALVVFLHPKCPCSRATLTELERMLIGPSGAAHPELQVVVAAVTPLSPGADWTISPLIERSQRLPAAELFVDRGGEEARRFGAVSSGTTIFFDAAGRRRYFGGVTLARGHEGENLGEAALARLLAGDDQPSASAPAFGCRLVAEHQCPTISAFVDAPARVLPPSIAATTKAPAARAAESIKQSFSKAE